MLKAEVYLKPNEKLRSRWDSGSASLSLLEQSMVRALTNRRRLIREFEVIAEI
ncbi:hypothetical protein Q0V21_15820 [Paenibacillus sp. 11B]|uniref:hypothetical protein n=1 Tax=Paenibacillus sp. 11B TaxID=3060965 RepID=UPI00264AFFDB|nr:hypothetical protein [Paenibacillus sp. 11B]MDN8590240.1 hypothetical protein [Paenibacillus sp. 11B]